MLVGAASVKEHERSLGIAGGGAKAVLHLGLGPPWRQVWLQEPAGLVAGTTILSRW
jgi:hypothetical protein